MVPRALLLVGTMLLVGLDSFSYGQQQRQQNQQRGDYMNFNNFGNDVENTFTNIEHLIAAASRNGGRRSGNKKSSKNSDDDYHVVYESKPESYSNAYHHSDNYRDAPRSFSYGSNDGNSGGGRKSSNSNNRRNDNRGGGSGGSNYNEDFDDYGDTPRKQQKPKSKYVDDFDYDSSDDTKRNKGFAHNEDFDRSTKEDYHKTGELKDDFDDFGRGGGGGSKSGGGRGGKGGRSRSAYSDSNSEIGDSDYVDDNEGFSAQGSSSGRGGRKNSREREDNPLDRYEQQTRQAIKEYGTVDRGSFLSANRYKNS